MRIVIADDAVLLREGAARLLEEAGHEVVAQAGDADDLLRKVRAHKPDVAIIDVRMPPDDTDDGLRTALTIRGELPDVGILLLSQYVVRSWVSWPRDGRTARSPVSSSSVRGPSSAM
jgi:DNA-binding NarL/FixJ family response regulator